MDIKRLLPIIAVATLAYLMVLQWSQDYGTVVQSVGQESVIETNPAATELSVPALTNNSADVPTVPASTEISASVLQPAADTLIYVETDVLKLAIDPRGGDIVQLSLPAYPFSQRQPNVPFQLFSNDPATLYVAQSGLTGSNGPDARAVGRPVYSTTQTQYRLANGQETLQVDLSFSEAGITFIKSFVFQRGQYDLAVRYQINNQSSVSWTGNLFAQIKRGDSPDPSSTTATSATYLGAAIWTPEKPYTKISRSNMAEQPFSQKIEGGWVAWLQHYFVTAWIAPPEQANLVTARKDAQGHYIVGFTAPAWTVPAGAKADASMHLYAGPKTQDHLKVLAPGLELTVDYGFLWFLAQPIFWLLERIHSLLGNWGWSIVVLTVLIKLLFFPLSAASYKSMARMRTVAPKLAALKEEFGEDRQKMSQAMMDLYKKEKINPLGGCLPILVQMPVFLALYWVLLESVEMRQAPWMFWITDLSIKDPYFLLPIIMGATMFIQMQLNPTPPDPMQAKMMKMMPIIFTFFFLWFPAGLVLYWVVNNVLSIAQQWVITRKIEAADTAS